jgi:predicted nucleic acid-binding Zn ribbon protein
MPRYDYYCDVNGQQVEVTHSMAERLTTWGEVCARASVSLGRTPAETPVRKLLSGAGVVRASVLKTPDAPPCGSGSCGSGRCGFE